MSPSDQCLINGDSKSHNKLYAPKQPNSYRRNIMKKLDNAMNKIRDMKIGETVKYGKFSVYRSQRQYTLTTNGVSKSYQNANTIVRIIEEAVTVIPLEEVKVEKAGVDFKEVRKRRNRKRGMGRSILLMFYGLTLAVGVFLKLNPIAIEGIDEIITKVPVAAYVAFGLAGLLGLMYIAIARRRGVTLFTLFNALLFGGSGFLIWFTNKAVFVKGVEFSTITSTIYGASLFWVLVMGFVFTIFGLVKSFKK